MRLSSRKVAATAAFVILATIVFQQRGSLGSFGSSAGGGADSSSSNSKTKIDISKLSPAELRELADLLDANRELDNDWHGSEPEHHVNEDNAHGHHEQSRSLPDTDPQSNAGPLPPCDTVLAVPPADPLPSPDSIVAVANKAGNRRRGPNGEQLTREEEDDEKVWPRTLVVGMPTVKRERTSYLRDTMKLLIERLDRREWKNVLIIVYPAEIQDMSFHDKVEATIRADLPEAVTSGLVVFLRAHPGNYPPLEGLHDNYGDPPLRVKWRAKQNIDYSILFQAAVGKARYYLQLEDDIVPDNNWYSQVLDFIQHQRSCTQGRGIQSCFRDWSMLQMGVGAIGCIFRDTDLEKVASFYRLFYDEQPVDWLNDRFITLRGQDFRVTSGVNLFKHIGLHSSLAGKVQFVETVPGYVAPAVVRSSNPPAKVTSSVDLHQGSLLDWYETVGGIAWLKGTQKDDSVTITFNEPIKIGHVTIVTGASFAEQDYVRNALIETSVDGSTFADLNASLLGGKMDVSVIPPRENVKALRLRITQTQTQWIVLREIVVK